MQIPTLHAESAKEREWLKRALALSQKEEFRKSKVLFHALTKLNNRAALYWFNLGNTCFELREFEEAIASYDTAASLNGPLAVPAILYGAKARRKLERFGEAKQRLQLLVQTNLPASVAAEVQSELASIEDAALGKALSFYQDGEYDLTLAATDGLLKINPTPDVFLLRGLVLVQQGKSESALRNFVQSIRRGATGTVREEAIRFIRQLRERRRLTQKKLELQLDFSAGYNSNVRLTGNSRSPAGKPVTRLVASAGYYPVRDQTVYAELLYLLNWLEVIGSTEDRLILQTAELDLVYDGGGFYVQVAPSFQYSLLELKPYLSRPGVFSRFERSYGSFDLGVSYDLGATFSGSAQYDYLKGTTHTVRAFSGYNFSNLYFSVFYRYIAENIGDLTDSVGTLPLSNRAHGPGISAVCVLASRWEINLLAQYSWLSYPSLALPENIERSDQQWSALIRFGYRIERDLSLFATFSGTTNVSSLGANNVDDRNYSQWTLVSGVLWSI